jgi:hypothetical protein
VYHKKHEREHTGLNGHMRVDRSDGACIMTRHHDADYSVLWTFQETSLNVMVALHVVVFRHEWAIIMIPTS